jgi:competence ComEA-like helix-hairpin-helix protein
MSHFSGGTTKLRMKTLWMLTAAASLSLALPQDDDVKALPDGPGREIVAKTCIECHGAASFRKMRLTEDEWWEKVGDMVDRGAKAGEKEQAAVVAYLARNFGKDSKVNVNTAPSSELTVVLGFPPAQSQAIVSYRTDYGKFKEWGDLLKVSGIDSKKVEAQKDKMAF